MTFLRAVCYVSAPGLQRFCLDAFSPAFSLCQKNLPFGLSRSVKYCVLLGIVVSKLSCYASYVTVIGASNGMELY